MRRPARSSDRPAASARSCRIAPRRSDTGRLAFGFSNQFFSFDHLDGVSLSAIPAVFRHDSVRARRRPRRRRVDDEHRRGDSQPVRRRVDLRPHQPHRLVAGGSDHQDAPVAALERAEFCASAPVRICRCTIFWIRRRSAVSGRRTNTSPKDRRAASATSCCASKTTMMREGSRALAAGLDTRLPTGDEQNLLGAGAMGLRPFAAVSAAHGRVRAAREHRLSMERRERPGRRRPRRTEADLPGPVPVRGRHRSRGQSAVQHGVRSARPARAELAAAVGLHA